LDEAAAERANSIGFGALNKVKEAKYEHREALTDAAEYENFLGALFVEELREKR